MGFYIISSYISPAMTKEDPMENWKQKMEAHCTEEWEIKLLRQGATSHATAMGLKQLKRRYEQIIETEKYTPSPEQAQRWLDDVFSPTQQFRVSGKVVLVVVLLLLGGMWLFEMRDDQRRKEGWRDALNCMENPNKNNNYCLSPPY